jgi:hypothetical protein
MKSVKGTRQSTRPQGFGWIPPVIMYPVQNPPQCETLCSSGKERKDGLECLPAGCRGRWRRPGSWASSPWRCRSRRRSAGTGTAAPSRRLRLLLRCSTAPARPPPPQRRSPGPPRPRPSTMAPVPRRPLLGPGPAPPMQRRPPRSGSWRRDAQLQRRSRPVPLVGARTGGGSGGWLERERLGEEE